MLGFSFPPSPLSSLAFVALIPLLVVLDHVRRLSRFLRYSYLSMLVFHAIALYWVGGFTHGRDPYLMIAGGALVLGHPLFYWIPLLLFWYAKRRLGPTAAWVLLPFFWTGFEFFHSLGEFSFPWLTLANSQAYHLPRIQMIDYTSLYGLSLLIVSFNVIAYRFLDRLARATPRWSAATFSLLGLLVALYTGPWIYGSIRMKESGTHELAHPMRVGIVQPNVDPWEKWGEGGTAKWTSYENQFRLLLRETRRLGSRDPDLVVWPETAVPFYLLLPYAAPYRAALQHLVDSLNVPVLTGLPDAEFFDSTNAPATAKPTQIPGRLVDYYNAATLFAPHRPPGQVYKKIKLVPFAERIPYAGTFSFLIEPLKWGVGISGWGEGKDTVVYTMGTRDSARVSFSTMICYESIYPSFVRKFVQKGAEFLVIITNDSWYGNTSGPYQHAAYASLRAVETRRWIVRCANGGISGFVDPDGRFQEESKMYTRATLLGSILPRQGETFYVLYGDIVGWVCIVISLAGFAAMVVLFRGRRIN